MNLTCESARPLVPSYLDGQLTELQASPLRTHLMACLACRETAKDEKVLKRWFAFEPERVSVPTGFSARVARRALAGDPGLLVPEPPPIAQRPRRSLLPVLLIATAAAAALLFFLALSIQRQNLPAGDGLDADESKAPPWLVAPEAQPLPLDADAVEAR